MEALRQVSAYTIAGAASELGVSRTTIYTWLDEGVLQEVRTEDGRRMVDAKSVRKQKIIRERGDS